ncbi:hypothetical protein Sango_0817000 [Sesamum angolense]|uniref:Reverse transcriptase n=1 Tax=Sesamum angolense TaxID=2727404 RepID=A0AAE1X368_9LAMI|nr:hypothetical protein Sango_0817000 [Sesamum angolense]
MSVELAVGQPVWRFTGIYREPDTSSRVLTWALLSRLHEQSCRPRLCAGDFNEILDNSEKRGYLPSPNWQMRNFRNVLLECDLHDISHIGDPFTWSNRQSEGPRPWRFEATWLQSDQCEEELEEVAAREETRWKQRSKELWLKEGDRSTSFFHRKDRNRFYKSDSKDSERVRGLGGFGGGIRRPLMLVWRGPNALYTTEEVFRALFKWLPLNPRVLTRGQGWMALKLDISKAYDKRIIQAPKLSGRRGDFVWQRVVGFLSLWVGFWGGSSWESCPWMVAVSSQLTPTGLGLYPLCKCWSASLGASVIVRHGRGTCIPISLFLCSSISWTPSLVKIELPQRVREVGAIVATGFQRDTAWLVTHRILGQGLGKVAEPGQPREANSTCASPWVVSGGCWRRLCVILSKSS